MDNIVSHYGIHWDDKGVAFLMQGRGGTNAVGLRERPPFTVKLPTRQRHCNHQIPLATPVPNDHHWDFFLKLQDDPLVRAMLPFPKPDGGVYFIEDDTAAMEQILVLLSKMASPIYNAVVPIWMLNKEVIVSALQETNVQPLVLTMVEAKHSDLISQVSKAATYLPRRLVIAGKSDVIVSQSVKRIETSLTDTNKYNFSELMALPWESLGATVVRKFMRKEWPPVANPRGSDGGTPKAKSLPRRAPG